MKQLKSVYGESPPNALMKEKVMNSTNPGGLKNYPALS